MQMQTVLGFRPNIFLRWHGGIYAITNTIDDRVYIGQSVCFAERLESHLRNLRRGKHANVGLQADWLHHGEECFSFDVLLSFRTTDLYRMRLDLTPYEDTFLRENISQAYNQIDARRGAAYSTLLATDR